MGESVGERVSGRARVHDVHDGSTVDGRVQYPPMLYTEEPTFTQPFCWIVAAEMPDGADGVGVLEGEGFLPFPLPLPLPLPLPFFFFIRSRPSIPSTKNAMTKRHAKKNNRNLRDIII